MSKILITDNENTQLRNFIFHTHDIKTHANKHYAVKATNVLAAKEKLGMRITDKDSTYIKSVEDSCGKRYVGKNLIKFNDTEDKVLLKDDASYRWMSALWDNNIAFEFVRGGYGMRFKSDSDYARAKEYAKKLGMTQGHWDDKSREYSDYHAVRVGDETCDVKDEEAVYTVSYVQNGVNQIIGVKANSESEARDKLLAYKQRKQKQVEVVGVRKGFEFRPGFPIIDECGADSPVNVQDDNRPAVGSTTDVVELPEHELHNTMQMLRDGITSEIGAIQLYDTMVQKFSEYFKKTSEQRYKFAMEKVAEIRDEEKKHVGEFEQILAELDKTEEDLNKEGKAEVNAR